MSAFTSPEFSRPISVARLGNDPAVHRIAATASELTALAARFAIPAVHNLEAMVTLSRRPGGDILFAAELRARVTQTCVVTLEALDVTVDEPFALVFRAGIDEDEADRIALEELEEEIVEPLINDMIDIGEAVAQQLSLALDPYPRAPGVAADIVSDGSGDAATDPSPARENPFAALLGRMKS